MKYILFLSVHLACFTLQAMEKDYASLQSIESRITTARTSIDKFEWTLKKTLRKYFEDGEAIVQDPVMAELLAVCRPADASVEVTPEELTTRTGLLCSSRDWLKKAIEEDACGVQLNETEKQAWLDKLDTMF